MEIMLIYTSKLLNNFKLFKVKKVENQQTLFVKKVFFYFPFSEYFMKAQSIIIEKDFLAGNFNW